MCKNSEIERNDEQPLLERLEAYGRTDVYPFHMPGHKRRLGPKEIGHLYEMDITEIDGFDNNNGDFEYRPVSAEVFYEMTLKYPGVKSFFNWDDGTQMDYYDWIECVKFLMNNFS